MVVGVFKLTFFLPHSHSLKDKRQVVRKIKDRVRERFDVSFAEVDALDQWQKGVLAAALVSRDAVLVQSILDQVRNYIESLDVAQVIDGKTDILHFKE